MLNDLRLSVRALRRAPLSSLAAICTLAIAIGASAAVFSVVDKVLIRPLPIEDPDRVVVVWPRERANPTTIGEISNFTFRAWQREVRSFQRLAAMGSTNWSLILREGEAATLPIAVVSGEFFPMLGARAAVGRTLRPEDDRQGSGRVAVMSHGAWVRRFGSDPGIVGRSLRFESGAYTIVGIMPDEFDYPRGAELWVPFLPELADSGDFWKVDTVNDPSWGVLFLPRPTRSRSVDRGGAERGVVADCARRQNWLPSRDGGRDDPSGRTHLRRHTIGTCCARHLRRVRAPHRLCERCCVAADAHSPSW